MPGASYIVTVMSLNTFQALTAFLDQFGGEVEGRELQEPSEETKARLLQLARGGLPARDRAPLMGELRQHPEWLAWLAGEVKALRGTEHSG